MDKIKEAELFKFYSDVRNSLVEEISKAEKYSDYWDQEVSSLGYIFEASPALLSALREHTFWLTGDLVYNYKKHHEGTKKHEQISFRYNQMLKMFPEHSFVSEPTVLGGFGFQFRSGLVNIDTLKFNESMIAIDRSFPEFKLNPPLRILEVGSGFGGMIHVLKSQYSSTKFVVVDLPQVLIFSAIFLKALYPDASIEIVKDNNFSAESDFLLCSNSNLKYLNNLKIDLMINICSFQEMTGKQVETYAKFARENGVNAIYSHNRTKGPYNTEIESVSEMIKPFFPSEVIVNVFPTDYTHLVWESDELLANKKSLRNRLRPRLKSKRRKKGIGKKNSKAVNGYTHRVYYRE